MDVDGVLTDGGIWYTDRGDELKRFDVRDGQGLVLLREAGVVTAIVTRRRSEIVERRARELGIAERVTFLGAQSRQRVVELFRAADGTILSSSWENFPHTVVEALAVGTPVLAMEVGGVAEVVHDGENGLLVTAGDTAALGEAVRRFFEDDALRERLRAAAAASIAAYAPERVFGELESALERIARR
jgi:glycosyltransferase involved in cell wall biosynthesis